MKNSIVLFENASLTTIEKCLAYKPDTKEWGFVSHGPICRTIFSTIYDWTKSFTPIYWDKREGDRIPLNEYSFIEIRNTQPSLKGVTFGHPTRVL